MSTNGSSSKMYTLICELMQLDPNAILVSEETQQKIDREYEERAQKEEQALKEQHAARKASPEGKQIREKRMEEAMHKFTRISKSPLPREMSLGHWMIPGEPNYEPRDVLLKRLISEARNEEVRRVLQRELDEVLAPIPE